MNFDDLDNFEIQFEGIDNGIILHFINFPNGGAQYVKTIDEAIAEITKRLKEAIKGYENTRAVVK